MDCKLSALIYRRLLDAAWKYCQVFKPEQRATRVLRTMLRCVKVGRYLRAKAVAQATNATATIWAVAMEEV